MAAVGTCPSNLFGKLSVMDIKAVQFKRVDEYVASHGAPSTADAERSFVIASPTRALQAKGIARTLTAGSADTLGQRVNRFFSNNHDGPGLLVGALPFDRTQSDYLVQPVSVTPVTLLPVSNATKPRTPWQVSAQPSAAEYSAMVARALEYMKSAQARRVGLNKVVLARRLSITADAALEPLSIAARLAQDPAVTAFVVPLPAQPGAARYLVGGTPELLVAKKGQMVFSNPLAGSARRNANAALDHAAAEALLASEKDQREHAMVVEEILDNLAPYCEQLATPNLAALQSTASMWHLGTKIEGRLKNAEVSSAELAACVHPTPAVAGFPRTHAQALIHQLEPFERGFYAGAVGWTDDAGDGEWYVSLRCGEVSANQIMLYAGAGIVAGSDPLAEAEETSGKFMALLNALGVNEQGRPLSGGSA